MLVAAVPFMIIWDLISGNRVAKLEAQLAKSKERSRGAPHSAYAEQKFDRVSIFDAIRSKARSKAVQAALQPRSEDGGLESQQRVGLAAY